MEVVLTRFHPRKCQRKNRKILKRQLLVDCFDRGRERSGTLLPDEWNNSASFRLN